MIISNALINKSRPLQIFSAVCLFDGRDPFAHAQSLVQELAAPHLAILTAQQQEHYVFLADKLQIVNLQRNTASWVPFRIVFNKGKHFTRGCVVIITIFLETVQPRKQLCLLYSVSLL